MRNFKKLMELINTIHKLKTAKIPNRDFPLPLEKQFEIINNEDERELEILYQKLNIIPKSGWERFKLAKNKEPYKDKPLKFFCQICDKKGDLDLCLDCEKEFECYKTNGEFI
jgi:hypothetical protein